MKHRHTILYFALVDAVLALAAVLFCLYALTRPLNLPENGYLLEVTPGSTLSQLTKKLSAEDMLEHGLVLVLYARLTGQTNIKVGEYRLGQQLEPLDLLKALNRGDVVSYQLTLVEGKTVRNILDYLSQQVKLQQTLKRGLGEEELLAELGIDYERIEGLFFPDTYHYTKGVSDRDILLQAHERLKTVLEQEWKQRQPNLPYQSSYDALIMASIIEKETGVAEERAEIAGVFVRRLQRGMKLQTDPTVIYGLGDTYQGNIKRRHLVTDTPYNTYTRKGLPPGPIALAGREAIHAALHPAEGASLYFVGMGDGRHYFSESLKEHEEAVRKYQLNRKADYRSVPVNE